nr:tyrosine-type recombinase/integrase [Rhodospirillaceae bacterium]
MAKITKRIVDSLKPGNIAWDGEVSGFGVRCQRKAKVYIVKTAISGRPRWFTIGKHGSPWTVEKARTKAKSIIGDIADGKAPAKDRDANKDKPTVATLCERYLEDYAKEHKKPSSLNSDQKNIDNHVIPLLGREFVASVTLADIDRFKRAVKDGKTARNRKKEQQGGPKVTGGKGVANRCIALLSKMFNLAERWGWRPDGSNPCRHVDRYPENRRERFLSDKELSVLAGELNKAEGENLYSVAAIRLLIFTGARLGEILNLKWEQVDMQRAMLLLPDSKTGQKAVFLSAPALDVLANLPRMENNPFVICGDREGAHLVNLQKPWRRVRKKAKLEDVRLHDLRHSFASVAACFVEHQVPIDPGFGPT